MSNLVVFANEYRNEDAFENLVSYMLDIDRSFLGKNVSNNEYAGYGVNTYSPEHMIRTMKFVQNLYHKNSGKRLHHFCISLFKRGRYDIETNRTWCNLIQNDIGNELLDMGYQSICAIHVSNGGIVHIHFLVNSVNMYSGKKLTDEKLFYGHLLKFLKLHYPSLSWEDTFIIRKRNT